MKICVYGAGAIGGVLAARLALAGRTVSVIARGAHLAAIRAEGLKLHSESGERTVKVPASDRPADFGRQDLVICTAKAYSLTSVARGIAPLLAPETPVVFATNGIPWWYFHKLGGRWDGTRIETVDPGGEIWQRIGPQRAIGCVVYMGASMPTPGTVKHHSGGRFLIGEPDNTLSARLKAVAAAMAADGLSVETTERIRDEILGKLIGNVSFNPISALTRSPLGGILSRPGLRQLAKTMMEECQNVGVAIGANLQIEIEAKLNGYERMAAFRTSTLQDLEAGRPLEIDALVGVVSELGHITGTPTPTIDTVYALLRALAENIGQFPRVSD